MKTSLFKNIGLLLCFLPLLVWSNDGKFNGKYTKEKTIKKEYEVEATALLKIRNSYGNIVLTSWNENRVEIEVHIKTNGNNEEKVQKRLDEIDVEFEASPDKVYARTTFGNSGKSWGWNWGKSNNVDVKVNYTVKLPVKNSIYLSNDYGKIALDRIDGHAKIYCDYGQLDIGELRGRNNELNFDYTNKSNINYVNSAKINADYSSYTIDRAGDLKLNTDYTSSTVNSMGNLEFLGDYGSLDIGELKNVSGNSDYGNIKLGKVHGIVYIKTNYGSLKIQELAADAGGVSIRTEYTGVKIGYAQGYNFDFEISSEYANIKGREDFEILESQEKNSQRYYKGYRGNSGSGKLVKVSADYGSVTFYKN